jgi:hypothetical protein
VGNLTILPVHGWVIDHHDWLISLKAEAGVDPIQNRQHLCTDVAPGVDLHEHHLAAQLSLRLRQIASFPI